MQGALAMPACGTDATQTSAWCIILNAHPHIRHAHTHNALVKGNAHSHNAARTCDNLAPRHCACPRLERLLAALFLCELKESRLHYSVVDSCCREGSTELGRREGPFSLKLLLAAGRLHTRVAIIAVSCLKADLARVQIPRLS